jgi:hypothetical protein
VDPVTEIVAALGAGAASALQDGTKDAVKAAYARLYELVTKRFSGHPSAENALAGHQATPQAGEARLAAKLTELGAAGDSQLVNAARDLLLLLNEAGKFSAKAHGFQGGQFGNGNIMFNYFYPGHPLYRPDAADVVRLASPALPSREDLMRESRAAPALAGRVHGRHWSPAFSRALAYSLGEFPSMEDAGFRNLFLRRVREQLGMPGVLRMSAHEDARDHILAIVYACQDHEDPVAAVKALHDIMAEFRPGTAGLGLLQDCYWAVSGMAALRIERLHSVLEIIGPLSRECDTVTVHGIAHEATLPDEVLPLRGSEDLVTVLRRLNVAQVSASARVPIVVRFLARLASRIGGAGGSRLNAEVEGILRELDVPADGLNVPPASAAPDDSARILQIRMEEASSPDNPRYAIDAAVFSVASGSRHRIMSWRCDEDCSLDDMDDVGGRFLEHAEELGRFIGEARDLMVEFLLPWSLLGHPVERWRLDEDGYWIGHAFPVVIRSLDRQRKGYFYQSWRRRWDLLSGENGGMPVGQQIGWLHHGNGGVPEHAARADRIVHLTGRNALTQWLEKEENCDTAALGLTFAYKPDDPVAVSGVKAAVHEGIPLLVWLRGQGDASQLERMLEDVDIRDLPGRVRKWRRETADSDACTSDARYHVVLLWDDPSGVGRPSEPLAAPR